MTSTAYSLFVSYSRNDSTFVDHLVGDLQKQGYHTWLDRAELKGGDQWDTEIQHSLDACDVVLAVLSPDAVASIFVRSECLYAVSIGKKVIPLIYRACEMPFFLNLFHHINFEQNYQNGLTPLLIALPQLTATPVFAPNSPLNVLVCEDDSRERERIIGTIKVVFSQMDGLGQYDDGHYIIKTLIDPHDVEDYYNHCEKENLPLLIITNLYNMSPSIPDMFDFLEDIDTSKPYFQKCRLIIAATSSSDEHRLNGVGISQNRDNIGMYYKFSRKTATTTLREGINQAAHALLAGMT